MGGRTLRPDSIGLGNDGPTRCCAAANNEAEYRRIQASYYGPFIEALSKRGLLVVMAELRGQRAQIGSSPRKVRTSLIVVSRDRRASTSSARAS